MKKYLLPNMGNYYKANMHCHSTCSDGRCTPQTIKEMYKEKGYSIVAFTDHEILLDHSYLNDENFLALLGYEISFSQEDDRGWMYPKCCHINLYPKDQSDTIQVCFNKNKLFANAANYLPIIKYKGEPYKYTYSAECINDVIKTAVENNFLVSYNHPEWSMETIADYINYDGYFAIELYNHGSGKNNSDNILDYNALLRHGKRVFPFATDDCHDVDAMFGGFIMINAEKLEYKQIIHSLENGDFYASTGPEITSLYTGDGKVYITCSPAKSVWLCHDGRHVVSADADDGTTLTKAVLDIPQGSTFIRVIVIDSAGKKAYTRGYFKDEGVF